jgi:hypothetical protein
MKGRACYWKILLGVLLLSAVASAKTISIPASFDGDVVYNGGLGFTVDDTDDRVSTSRSSGADDLRHIGDSVTLAVPAGANLIVIKTAVGTANAVAVDLDEDVDTNDLLGLEPLLLGPRP